jgi:hypothetical protein
MTTSQRIGRVLRNPALITARVKRTFLYAALQNPELLRSRVKEKFLYGGILQDTEAMHMVRAWSTGSLERKKLAQLFPGIESCGAVSIRKPESRIVGWSLDLQELIHLLSVIKFTRATRILEIGTYDGFTALNIAANLENGAQVSTVDLPQDREAFKNIIGNASETSIVGSQYLGEKEADRINQLWADSTTTDWSAFGSPFDLILVDGCHAYPYVMSDSRNALRHIRPGGTIFWHDYGYLLGVSQALDELARDYPIKAIAGTRFACYRSPG